MCNIANLIQEISPRKNFCDLILPDKVQQTCLEIAQEHQQSGVLRSYNVEPRNRILLIGPPGNGKTSTAEALAGALMMPFYILPMLQVLQLIVHIRQLQSSVLFFDGFETLDDKGMRNFLLRQISALPSHIIVVAATNSPELLDCTVWQHFQVRMMLPNPPHARLVEWFEHFQKRIAINLGYSPEKLAEKLHDCNFATIEEFGATIYRQHILQPKEKMRTIVQHVLHNWCPSLREQSNSLCHHLPPSATPQIFRGTRRQP